MNSPIETISGSPLNQEQASYLDGFFSGLRQQGVRFTDVALDPTQAQPQATAFDDLSKEEQLKSRTDLNNTFKLVQSVSASNKVPDAEETFLLKWHGLFHLAPKQDGFMCRLRIPGGYVHDFQLRELARISKELTSGYIQITTRANFQIRVIPLEQASNVLHRIQSVGLHSKGAGADNIRNITASPCAGVDPEELIDVKPLCLGLAQHIISTDEFYNLPRKFNIAFDGGGAIGVVEDTNDIGAKAVRIPENFKNQTQGIYFLIALGGVTGHKTFASDAGILVSPELLQETILTMTRVFIQHGNRSSRKKARLKYLLEDWGIRQFLNAVDEGMEVPLIRLQEEDMERIREWNPVKPQVTEHAHLGTYRQIQDDLHYVGVGIPTGVLTPDQLEGLADLCQKYGNGEARLTVWQNLVIPNVPTQHLEALKQGVLDVGLYVDPSNIRSGVIACTGNSFCKFASANTKGHAMELMEYLEEKCPMDQPINIHLTGCPHSCAQHYIGDIGLLATQVKRENGIKEGYHVFVGGGFGDQKEMGRQVAKAVPFEDLPGMLSKLIFEYQSSRWPDESFQSFTQRHSTDALLMIMESSNQATHS